MIVHELSVVGAAFAPGEADAELVVDADRPLTAPVIRQWVQAVAARLSQIIDLRGGVESLEPTTSDTDKIGREALAGITAFKDRLRLL